MLMGNVGQDDHGGAELHAALEVGDVFVAQPDAAFGGAGADGFGEGGAVDADVAESRDVEAEEPGAIGILDGAFPVMEIMLQPLGIEQFIDPELSFRGLVVAGNLLGSRLTATEMPYSLMAFPWASTSASVSAVLSTTIKGALPASSTYSA